MRRAAVKKYRVPPHHPPLGNTLYLYTLRIPKVKKYTVLLEMKTPAFYTFQI